MQEVRRWCWRSGGGAGGREVEVQEVEVQEVGRWRCRRSGSGGAGGREVVLEGWWWRWKRGGRVKRLKDNVGRLE